MMYGIAVKPVRHNTSLYPVGAVLGAPEFTEANLDTLFRIDYARPVATQNARLLLIAKQDLVMPFGAVSVGDEIPDGLLDDATRAELLNAGALGWVPDCVIADGQGAQGYRAVKEVRHRGAVYAAGGMLPDGDFKQDEFDLLVRIGLVERVPIKSKQPKHEEPETRRRRKN